MKNLTIAFLATTALFTVGGCKKKGGGDAGEAVAKVSEFKDKMCGCKDKDCANKVNDEYTKWGTEMASKMASNKEAVKPDEAMAKKMTEVAMAYGECMTKAMGAGGTAPAADTGSAAAPAAGSGEAAPAAAGGDMPAGVPQECKDYADAMAKLGTCDKMPKESKDAMKQGFDAMKTGWANFDKMPAEAQKAAADACKQGTDALKQSAGALGC